MAKKYDVVGVGSALLDMTLNVEDDFLKKLGLHKGEMALVDEQRFEKILDEIKGLETKRSSGGSVANSMIGISRLGGKAMFIGKVGKDASGKVYKELLAKSGVTPVLSTHEKMTGTAITFVTPDSERSFATYLGAASFLTEEDIHEEHVNDAKILHLEGYLLDVPSLREAAIKAMRIAKKAGMKVSLDLSDPGVVRRHRDILNGIVNDYADIVFANESEAKEYAGLEEEQALDKISTMCEVAIVKLGEKGSLIKKDGKTYRIPIQRVSVANTNGAGDAYAAGILFAIANKLDLESAGKIAAYISAQVVASHEATVSRDLRKEIEKMLR
ncbi:MAG: adenosine kinase [archaeon]